MDTVFILLMSFYDERRCRFYLGDTWVRNFWSDPRGPQFIILTSTQMLKLCETLKLCDMPDAYKRIFVCRRLLEVREMMPVDWWYKDGAELVEITKGVFLEIFMRSSHIYMKGGSRTSRFDGPGIYFFLAFGGKFRLWVETAGKFKSLQDFAKIVTVFEDKSPCVTYGDFANLVNPYTGRCGTGAFFNVDDSLRFGDQHIKCSDDLWFVFFGSDFKWSNNIGMYAYEDEEDGE